MRLKSAIWVAAYVRRCHVEGAFAAVRRRGAEEAGAIFVKLNRLDGTAELFGPAPQSVFDDARPSDRLFSRRLDRRGRGPRRAPFPRSGRGVSGARTEPRKCVPRFVKMRSLRCTIGSEYANANDDSKRVARRLGKEPAARRGLSPAR